MFDFIRKGGHPKEKPPRKDLTIDVDGTTYITPDALASFNVRAAEEFLGKKLDIHVVKRVE